MTWLGFSWGVSVLPQTVAFHLWLEWNPPLGFSSIYSGYQYGNSFVHHLRRHLLSKRLITADKRVQICPVLIGDNNKSSSVLSLWRQAEHPWRLKGGFLAETKALSLKQSIDVHWNIGTRFTDVFARYSQRSDHLKLSYWLRFYASSQETWTVSFIFVSIQLNVSNVFCWYPVQVSQILTGGWSWLTQCFNHNTILMIF